MRTQQRRQASSVRPLHSECETQGSADHWFPQQGSIQTKRRLAYGIRVPYYRRPRTQALDSHPEKPCLRLDKIKGVWTTCRMRTSDGAVPVLNIDVSTVEGQLEVLRLWSSAELNISSACLDPPLGVFCNEGVKESTAILVGPWRRRRIWQKGIFSFSAADAVLLSASVISALAGHRSRFPSLFRAAAGSRNPNSFQNVLCFWMACSWDWLARLVRRKPRARRHVIALANCL